MEMGWPLGSLIFGIFVCLIFYRQIGGLLNRITGAGKDGVKFVTDQQPVNAGALTFVDLMKLPVMKSVTEREPTIQAQFDKFHLKTEGEKVTTLIRALASANIEADFYRAAIYIFGSQLSLLANMTGSSNGISIEDAKSHFSNAKALHPQLHTSRSYEEWAAFLETYHFVFYQDSRLHLSTLGADFMKFLIDKRLAYTRSG